MVPVLVFVQNWWNMMKETLIFAGDSDFLNYGMEGGAVPHFSQTQPVSFDLWRVETSEKSA